MSDYDRNRRLDRADTPWGWIIGGLVALAVIIGGIYAMNRPDTASTASNNTGAASSSNTTGSGAGTGSTGNSGAAGSSGSK